MNYGFIRFLPDLKFQGGQQSVHPSKEHDQGAQEHDQTKVSSPDKNYKCKILALEIHKIKELLRLKHVTLIKNTLYIINYTRNP